MGNFGGFGGNMQQLMKQAQKMQQDMVKAKEKLDSSEVNAVVGGGIVEVIMKGDKTLSSIKIKKEAVDVEDLEMLEDLIIAAVNEANKKVDELKNQIMGPYSGAMGGLI
jgi:DNA-binding YbaB/EbfC family protein